MTYSASTLLSLPIITSGTESGLWGNITNNGLTEYLDISIAGSLSLTTDADVDLAKTAGTSSATNIGSTTAQYMVLLCTGSRTVTRNINAPKQSKLYVVINATTGSQSVVIRGGPTSPTTGVTVTNGEYVLVAWNGSDFVRVATSIANVGTTATQTLTNKRITPRANITTTTSSPWAWNSDSYDIQGFTALANALTINADAGTPTDGQKTIFRLKDDGTARALTWTTGSSKAFRAVGITLPTTTVISKVTYVGCIYNSNADRWDAVATGTEA